MQKGARMREGQKQNLARGLRRTMTDAERRLWRHLRNRELLGWKFRRQHPIGPYVVDFVCLEAMLVIDADGGQHNASTSDRCRDDYLRSEGFRVLRVWNHDVLTDASSVLQAIVDALAPVNPALPDILC